MRTARCLVTLALFAGALVVSCSHADSGTYATTGAHLVEAKRERDAPAGPAVRWNVVFDARWTGPTDPPKIARECHYRVLDRDGHVLFEADFGLYVGRGQDAVRAPQVVDGSGFPSPPDAVDVTCG